MKTIQAYWIGVIVTIVIFTIIAGIISIKKRSPSLAHEWDAIAWGCEITGIGTFATIIIWGVACGIAYSFGIQVYAALAITVAITCGLFMAVLYGDIHGRCQ